jgi:hypothetical protein
MTFSLSKDQYNLLKTIDFTEIKKSVRFHDGENEVEVKREAIRLFQVIISEEIDRNGLTDDQDDVTPKGRKLYALYDAIYNQI